MRTRSMLNYAAVLIGTIALAGIASATDGVIEINQAKALAGEVTPGDPAGFPVVLNSGGSYRLTSDLSTAFLGAGGTTVSVIQSFLGNINLDLNGFTVAGPNLAGTASCINFSGGANVRVSNGTVQQCPLHGIDVSGGSVDLVIAANNKGSGIRLNNGWIDRSEASYNLARGVDGFTVTVRNTTAFGNGGDGIYLAAGLVEGCNLSTNTGAGIKIGGGLVRGSRSGNNTGFQLHCDGAFCALNANIFENCAGASCLTGLTAHIPAGSNYCGNVVCP